MAPFFLDHPVFGGGARAPPGPMGMTPLATTPANICDCNNIVYIYGDTSEIVRDRDTPHGTFFRAVIRERVLTTMIQFAGELLLLLLLVQRSSQLSGQ